MLRSKTGETAHFKHLAPFTERSHLYFHAAPRNENIGCNATRAAALAEDRGKKVKIAANARKNLSSYGLLSKTLNAGVDYQ